MFTMTEYIAQHKLGVSPFDKHATRKIAEHLTARGYVKRKMRHPDGKVKLTWVKGTANLDVLAERLKAIK